MIYIILQRSVLVIPNDSVMYQSNDYLNSTYGDSEIVREKDPLICGVCRPALLNVWRTQTIKKYVASREKCAIGLPFVCVLERARQLPAKSKCRNPLLLSLRCYDPSSFTKECTSWNNQTCWLDKVHTWARIQGRTQNLKLRTFDNVRSTSSVSVSLFRRIRHDP